MKKYTAYIATGPAADQAEIDTIQDTITRAYGGATWFLGYGAEANGPGESMLQLIVVDFAGLGPEPFERAATQLADLMEQEAWLFEEQEVVARVALTERGVAQGRRGQS